MALRCDDGRPAARTCRKQSRRRGQTGNRSHSVGANPLRTVHRGHEWRSRDMTALLVTIDELRALRRIMDIWLPGFVVEEDDEDLRVDAAALRGLAARGLVSLPAGADIPAYLALAPPPARHLAPS